MPKRMQEVLEDFEWTRPYHRGDLDIAAWRLGMTKNALEQHLSRARRRGCLIEVRDAWTA